MKKRAKKRIAIFFAAAAIVCAGICLGIYLGELRYYITQYADTTGMQAMFYTIESNRGELIVIDGGNAGNAEYVREVIRKKGGHVDAWILTHPHPDHIGAFNVLWDEMQSRIDVIYTTQIDYLTYRDRAFEWDGFEGYDLFLNYMSETDKMHYLHTGDQLNICGLDFEILHACDDYVYEVSHDIGNDSGLMMLVTNQEESMLFCADVGVMMSDKIIGQYGSRLACDYIQMGHHGNGGLSEAFYRLTLPRAAFFDAPDWLMNPAEEGRYTTPENRKLMESMGAEIYSYETAPNRIRLK
ncbi:MAG: MBL fold metallo-hydrolase [Lachnospiraceae bacterium]|nr:MBL fold metallo-hydrolase [Lachnospiraceae bacterium]